MSALPENPRSIPLPLSDAAPAIDTSVWYAEGLRFACTQCGNCCTGAPGYVWVTLDDMERIAAHLQLPFDEFTRRHVRRVDTRFALLEKPNYDCTFLTRDANGKTGCAVYPVRPMQCRTWPFWSENLRSEATWQRTASRPGGCPGIRDPNAPRYDLAHIEACRQHLESPH